MESLKKYIRKNRDSFDEKEPLEGHFDRFRQKLEARKYSRKIHPFIVAAAAAIAGLVLTGTMGLLYNNSNWKPNNQNGISLSVVSPELKEVEDYYQSQIDSKYNQIKSLNEVSSPEIATEVNKAITDMDLGYKTLKKDLSDSPKRERIVSAMIQQYQLKIEMLDQILNTLQGLKQLNIKQ